MYTVLQLVGVVSTVWFSMQICSIEFHSFDSCVGRWQDVYALRGETKLLMGILSPGFAISKVVLIENS